MTQTAQVRRLVGDGRAEVIVRRKTACGHDCSQCGGCEAGAEVREVLVVAENGAGAAVGDTVTVESSTPQVLGIAVVVYLVPFALFFLFYAVGALLHLSETASILIGAAGFACGLGVDLALNRAKQKHALSFRITGIQRG